MRILVALLAILWVSPAVAQTWVDLTEPTWSHHAVRAIEADTVTGHIYAGLAGGPNGSAEVWERSCDCVLATWTQIGGDSINGSWTDGNSVSTLLLHNGDLYAGLGYTISEVWRYRAGAWTQVGGNLIANSWSEARHEWAYEIVEWQGSLYVGLRNNASPHGGAVYRLHSDDTWSAIGKWDGVGGVYSMLETATHLYLGMDGKADSPNAAQVWSWDGAQWEQVGGEGINGSWSFGAETSLVESLIEFNGEIVATIGTATPDATHHVWSYDPVAKTWSEVGTEHVNWAGWHIMNDSLVVGGSLYVAGGGVPANGASAGVYRFDDPGYTQIGGDSVNGSWPTSYAGVDTQWVYRLHEYQSGFLAGLAGGGGGAQLWAHFP